MKLILTLAVLALVAASSIQSLPVDSAVAETDTDADRLGPPPPPGDCYRATNPDLLCFRLCLSYGFAGGVCVNNNNCRCSNPSSTTKTTTKTTTRRPRVEPVEIVVL